MKITKRKYITTITYDKICNGVKKSCIESFFDKKYVDIRVDESNKCLCYILYINIFKNIKK